MLENISMWHIAGDNESGAAGGLDNQQSRIEQGNAGLLQQDPFLVELLSQDAAGLTSHQVISQNLCTSNLLLRPEPRTQWVHSISD